MAGKHTPAPWSAFTDDSGSKPHTNIVSVVPHTDCVFSLPGMHKDDPNVRLITAAPDLLKIAMANLETLFETRRRLIRFGKSHDEINIAITETEAAIARATPKESADA